MINITEQGDTVDYGVLSLVADTSDDLEELKANYNASNTRPGSTCLVINTSTVYMMNSLGEWKPL